LHTKLSLKDHFHFIGIGGIGMSAVAIALIKKDTQFRALI